MFEYMFIMFGINCGNNYLSNIFTGLTIAIFSLFMIQIPLTINLCDITSMNAFKLLNIVLIALLLISYIIIKYKSNKIFEL